MPHPGQRRFRGLPVIVLAPILSRVALLVGLTRRFLDANKTQLTAEEVWAHLDNFIENRGGDRDWDDFTSCPLKSPELEAIRFEADHVPLPVTTEGMEALRTLRSRAASLKAVPRP